MSGYWRFSFRTLKELDKRVKCQSVLRIWPEINIGGVPLEVDTVETCVEEQPGLHGETLSQKSKTLALKMALWLKL